MDRAPQDDGFENPEEGFTRYRAIIDAALEGVFVITLDGTITYVNDEVEASAGRGRAELVGGPFDRLIESELIPAGESERFATAVHDFVDADGQERHLRLGTVQENDEVVDIRLSKHLGEDATDFVVGAVRDVTERERRVWVAERKQAVLAQLYEVGADASLTFEEKTERILAIGCEYLDLPYGFLTRVEEGVQQMVHTVGNHELLQPDTSAPLEKSYCRKTIKSDGLVGMQDARMELGANDDAYQLFELGCYIGTKVLVGEQLFGTFCFAAPHERDRTFTSGEREVIKLLGQWTGYELERQRFEERLEGLHRISQQLLVAETAEEVAQTTIEMGADLFDLPVTAFWEYDAGDDVLRPLAETTEASQIVGEAPTFDRGEGLVWESFDSDDVRSYEDVTDRPERYNPETAIRSEVHVPCGNHGIITSAATETQAFDEIDIESLRLLGALVTEAMTAVKREERIVERGEMLQRQNERLEEFANLVAHDLRNPLAGAIASLEVAQDTDDAEFFDRVDRSLGRMDDLIDELLDIARGNRQEVVTSSVPLQSTVEEAWSYIDTSEATLSVEGDLGEIQADETRLLQLFSNLFRNSVEHAGEDVTVEVGPLGDGGFYVADDGPGLSEDSRMAIQEFGQVGSASGTGIGLMSVTDIVEAHEWELAIPDATEGARFEIRTGE